MQPTCLVLYWPVLILHHVPVSHSGLAQPLTLIAGSGQAGGDTDEEGCLGAQIRGLSALVLQCQLLLRVVTFELNL